MLTVFWIPAVVNKTFILYETFDSFEHTEKYKLCSFTCEGHLRVAVHALLLDAVLVRFGASSGPLHVAKVLAPSLPPGVFLQTFFFRSPVLKPNLQEKKV